MREIACPDFSARTTMRVGGTAIAEVILESRDDAFLLPERLRRLGGTILVLGAGSNILARDGKLPLVLVRPCLTEGPEVTAETNGKVYVRAGAGIPLSRLLRFCMAHGLSGLEGLAGIPGSVGGAVVMNAGSFGTETGEHLHSIEILTGTEIRQCQFFELALGYRSMSIPNSCEDFIVLSATFCLTKGEKRAITESIRHNFFKKKSKQPVTAWSAGCVFKNPSEAMPAGKLLDLVGFKGKSMGGMAFSTLHANFLINEGKGSATAALELMEEAKDAVHRQFGIELEPEVRIVPCLLR
ncbi:MAG: UDP-N-acetylmuramate dehydrogenase [Desulfovibrio sp.]|nr:UDP-N-acetylmuramate dehydrogenase [Desulfovibrio sp.]